MDDFLFNHSIQPFEQRALVRQQQEDNRREQVIGFEGNKIGEEANEIVRRGFDDLVSSTRDTLQAYESAQGDLIGELGYLGDDISSALNSVSSDLEEMNKNLGEGLGQVDKTLKGGFTATAAVMGLGFTALHRKIDEGIEEVSGKLDNIDESITELTDTVDTGLQEIDQTLDEGITELTEETKEGFAKVAETVDSGLQEIDQTLDEGITELTEETKEGFAKVAETVDSGLQEIDQTLDEGFSNVCETIEEGMETVDNTLILGFQEESRQLQKINHTLSQGIYQLSSLLENVSDELVDIKCEISQGFENLGSLFQWGFSEVIAQAELQNEKLAKIIHILLRPAATKARELYAHAVANYRRRLADEALKSFLYLLEEKEYWVVLGTYVPLHRLIANIYLFDKRDYDNAIRYYEFAVKYAPLGAKSLRALLLLHLGLCFYYKKDFVTAKIFVEKSLQEKYSLEAEYQLAQYCALCGESKEAFLRLKKIIKLNKSYVVKILREADFQTIQREVLSYLLNLNQLNSLSGIKKHLVNLARIILQIISKVKKRGKSTEKFKTLLRKLLDVVKNIQAQIEKLQKATK